MPSKITIADVSKFSQITGVTRQTIWRFFGALFMEAKDGVQAVSLNRVLSLGTYIAAMVMWLGDKAVPDSMLYTLWALLGINGAAKVASVIKEKTIATSIGADNDQAS